MLLVGGLGFRLSGRSLREGGDLVWWLRGKRGHRKQHRSVHKEGIQGLLEPEHREAHRENEKSYVATPGTFTTESLLSSAWSIPSSHDATEVEN